MLEYATAQPVPSVHSQYGLENHGFSNLDRVYWNLTTAPLYEWAVRRHECTLADLGPMVVHTGTHTGRSPNDKFVVREPSSDQHMWWGTVNRPLEPAKFDSLHQRLMAYFQNKEVYVQDCFAGTDPRYRVPIRVISEYAWHSLFAYTMFVRPTPEERAVHVPQFTIIQAPHFEAIQELDGTNSSTFIILNFARKMVLIGGTEYAGEAKKSAFTILNYLLPLQGVLSMHCSANYGKNKDDAALFFGLSGTGKTTLSADPHRTLIGDDEHGWSDDGVFNFEGGCYAKVIRLSREGEPDIYETTRRFGTVLENVAIDADTRQLDLDDGTVTENTRAAYPITHISNADTSGMCGHPKNVIFLTADAFGVLPPVARLTTDQAMYHFISGYTAKVAGTERGMSSEPQATFSACFAAPFLPLHPTVYANLLRQKLDKHRAKVWLINTGWTGGPYGVGQRMSIAHTRAIVSAALSGKLDDVETFEDPIFGLRIPKHVPDIPDGVLNPRNTWSDPASYDAKATELAHRFQQNFDKYADKAGVDLRAAGPKAG